MLERYTPNFASLSLDETSYLATAVSRRYSDFIPEQAGPYESGEDLMNHCDAYGYDQADVVMSLASDPSPQAVTIIERLVGQPITRPDPSRPRPAAKPRAPRAKRTVIDNRVIATVAPNPKRPGSASHARYELYRTGVTVTELLKSGLTTGDITHDTRKGFITFEET